MKIKMCNNDRIVKFVLNRLTTRLHFSRVRTDGMQWPPQDLSIGVGEGSA